MAIQITQWKPDTCGCVLQYSWDDMVPAEKREHKGHAVIKACKDHPGEPAEKHYEKIHEENTRKNKALTELPEAVSKKAKFRFDKDRNVILTLPDEAKADILVHEEKIKAKFAKVILE